MAVDEQKGRGDILQEAEQQPTENQNDGCIDVDAKQFAKNKRRKEKKKQTKKKITSITKPEKEKYIKKNQKDKSYVAQVLWRQIELRQQDKETTKTRVIFQFSTIFPRRVIGLM